MKKLFSFLAATWLVLLASASRASEQGANTAPEPTVSGVWAVVFVAMFLGLCVWFFVAILRNERKAKAAQNDAR